MPKYTWQPIESAPKDGKWIILFSTVEGVTCGYWGPTYFEYDPDWIHYSHRSESWIVPGKITHWMPLPEPPKENHDGTV